MPPLTTTQVFDGVRNRLFAVAFSFKLLEQLYLGGHSADARVVADRLKVMRSTAPGFFDVLWPVLVDNVLLGLSVLTDGPSTSTKTGKRDNLSFSRLLIEVRLRATKPEDAAELRRIEADVVSFVQAMDNIKLHRNRRIAHSDAAAHIDPSERLPDVPIADLRALSQQAFALANRMQCVLQPGHSTSYNNPIITGDGESVISGLQQAMKLSDLEVFLWDTDWSGKSAEQLRDAVVAFLRSSATP